MILSLKTGVMMLNDAESENIIFGNNISQYYTVFTVFFIK